MENSVQGRMAASYNEDQRGSSHFDHIEDKLNSLQESLSDISNSCQSSKFSFEHNLAEINDWVTEQKKKSKEKGEQIPVEKVGKFLEATINGSEKFKSGKELEIATSVLDIISSLASLTGEPNGPAIKALCGVVSVILTSNKPQQQSVVEQLEKFVHKELDNFNHKLQGQKYEGLIDRISDQIYQLRMMEPGEKLDDPNLWNDYVQFMGELSKRFESSLPFKYDKKSLTKDPEVKDFVTAVVTYCQAYNCFLALLTAAKGKFADLGSEYKDYEDAVDRKMRGQKEKAKEKLAFLSDAKYLTFLGRLPYEGGKLTKIVVLSRNTSGKRLVEVVRGSLSLPKMPDLATVESAATKVSVQSVKLKLEGHQVPPGNYLRWLVSMFRFPFWVQFINETDFPMKIVSGKVGRSRNNLKFVQDVQPHSSYPRGFFYTNDSTFSSGGYIMIYLNGSPSSDLEQPTEDTRVLEFALSRKTSFPFYVNNKINFQDKTNDEFTHGEDTHDAMDSGEAKTFYWFEGLAHFVARAEIVHVSFLGTTACTIWRFVVQNFDP